MFRYLLVKELMFLRPPISTTTTLFIAAVENAVRDYLHFSTTIWSLL